MHFTPFCTTFLSINSGSLLLNLLELSVHIRIATSLSQREKNVGFETIAQYVFCFEKNNWFRLIDFIDKRNPKIWDQFLYSWQVLQKNQTNRTGQTELDK